jgi:hypothetical protein
MDHHKAVFHVFAVKAIPQKQGQQMVQYIERFIEAQCVKAALDVARASVDFAGAVEVWGADAKTVQGLKPALSQESSMVVIDQTLVEHTQWVRDQCEYQLLDYCGAAWAEGTLPPEFRNYAISRNYYIPANIPLLTQAA